MNKQKSKRKNSKRYISVPALNFKDEQFDSSLMLGPMYHLQENDRIKAIKELKRVTKKMDWFLLLLCLE
ncbi:class I SAM-dependent methyltransferase [Neobacillus terrae]|uniref:class I SAM-dependent methyltransferase n=1 Tax=Neobacillus terrae TaxID=3034837 RepID=UPI00140BA95A|nr:class I SAM-dependent methyltransferase [Neobacillus terrae]